MLVACLTRFLLTAAQIPIELRRAVNVMYELRKRANGHFESGAARAKFYKAFEDYAIKVHHALDQYHVEREQYAQVHGGTSLLRRDRFEYKEYLHNYERILVCFLCRMRSLTHDV